MEGGTTSVSFTLTRPMAGAWKYLVEEQAWFCFFYFYHLGGLFDVRMLGSLVNTLTWVCKLCPWSEKTWVGTPIWPINCETSDS